MLLKAFGDVNIPMNSTEQDNISFSIAVFVAKKSQINVDSNCIIENISII